MEIFLEKYDILPEKGNKLFLETSEFYDSTEIGLGGSSQIYCYINSYKFSADALVNTGINSGLVALNNYVYLIIYNYKQFIELTMKSIYLFYSSDNVKIKKQNRVRVNHNLEKTWKLIEPLLNLVYTSPKDVSVMNAAKEYFIEFQNFNDNSFNFNYPFTADLITYSEKRKDIVNLKKEWKNFKCFLD